MTASSSGKTTSPATPSAGILDRGEKASADRLKAIDLAIGQAEKQFGRGAIMRLGDSAAKMQVEAIPTGALALDLVLGIGGLPRGRIVEIYGPESSGKTTLALHVVASAQRIGGIAAYIDVEHALDPVDAQNRCGVRIDDLLVSQPDTGEQALEICEMLVRSGAVDVVVVDSVAALVPRAEIEGDMGDSQPGLQARLMSQAMRKLTPAISNSRTMVIFINQIREKIGVMFGSPETTPGGKALKFYASVRLDIRRTDNVKVGTEVVGMRAKVTVRKNKVAPPFRVCEFDILWSEGISRTGSLLDLGVEMNIIKKAGAYFSFGDVKLGLGRENAREFLRQHGAVADEIETGIRANAKAGKVAAPAAPSAE
ncbi:MAG: recombinase RecA [Chloroflexi bacterium]|nr:MAG: recombinase RecA [Chloroflexota bacterium]